MGILVLFSQRAFSGVSPISIAMIPNIEFPSADATVAGLRMSVVWGEHRSVYGLDLGVIGNVTQQNFVGTAFSGIFNKTENTTILGIQAAGVANITTGRTTVLGTQLAGIWNYNSGDISVYGIQLAGLTNTASRICGVQVGFYNKADVVYGFQIGIVNHAQSLHGVQLGLVNYNVTGLIPMFPFINVGL